MELFATAWLKIEVPLSAWEAVNMRSRARLSEFKSFYCASFSSTCKRGSTKRKILDYVVMRLRRKFTQGASKQRLAHNKPLIKKDVCYPHFKVEETEM